MSNFINITSEKLERELSDLDSKIEAFIKAFDVSRFTEHLEPIRKLCDKYITGEFKKLKTINEKEKAISDLKPSRYSYDNTAAGYADYMTKNKTFLMHFENFVGRMGDSYCAQMTKFFLTMVMRTRLLKYYKENILIADPALFNAKYTMDKARDTLNYLDEKGWDIFITEKSEDIKVDVDVKSISSYYWNYHIYLKPTWAADVYDKGIALTDVAGKRVMIADAEEIPYTGILGSQVSLYLVKIAYSLVPQDSAYDMWGKSYTETEKYDLVRSTVHLEDKYLMTTQLTDGTLITATGKDDEWAERTLKSRLKRTMLKTMKIL